MFQVAPCHDRMNLSRFPRLPYHRSIERDPGRIPTAGNLGPKAWCIQWLWPLREQDTCRRPIRKSNILGLSKAKPNRHQSAVAFSDPFRAIQNTTFMTSLLHYALLDLGAFNNNAFALGVYIISNRLDGCWALLLQSINLILCESGYPDQQCPLLQSRT